MASGSYAKKVVSREPAQTYIPHRATRQLPVVKGGEGQDIIQEITKILPIPRPPKRIVDQFPENPLTRYLPPLRPFLITMVVVVVASFVLISAGIFQRPGAPQLIMSPNAQTFPIQVG